VLQDAAARAPDFASESQVPELVAFPAGKLLALGPSAALEEQHFGAVPPLAAWSAEGCALYSAARSFAGCSQMCAGFAYCAGHTCADSEESVDPVEAFRHHVGSPRMYHVFALPAATAYCSRLRESVSVRIFGQLRVARCLRSGPGYKQPAAAHRRYSAPPDENCQPGASDQKSCGH